MNAATRRRLLLVGVGHAHLATLRAAARFTERGFDVVALAPDDFWYSSLAVGVLSGRYPADHDRIDVAALLSAGGGRFVRDHAVRIDAGARVVHRAAGDPLPYDILSLNVGSVPDLDALPGAADQAFTVKPLSNLIHLQNEIVTRQATATPDHPLRIVIVGGGVTACELAANLLTLTSARPNSVKITLLAADRRLAPTLPLRASALLHRDLQKRGVEIILDTRAVRVSPDRLVLSANRATPADILIAATGLKPAAVVRASGLPTDAAGALLVNDQLQSVADPHIFGGGDCVTMSGHNLQRVGVYAVRQSAVLAANLLAALEGRPLQTYRPQRRFLQILNLGDGTGLAVRDRLWWRGRSALWLKERLDYRFMTWGRTPEK